jgi:DNA-binding transcriptional regulator YiaG
MKKYRTEALMVIHQDAEGLHRLGIISDAEMREFDEGCLVHEPKTAYEAKKSIKPEHILPNRTGNSPMVSIPVN